MTDNKTQIKDREDMLLWHALSSHRASSVNVDVEAELQKFHRGNIKSEQQKVSQSNWKPTLFGFIGGIAASLLMFIAVRVFMPTIENTVNPVAVYLAEKDVQDQVTLQQGSRAYTIIKDESLNYQNAETKAPVVNNELQIVTTPSQKVFTLTLADGTVVSMNQDSQLSFPDRFGEGERVVHLKGEAYFNVAKDSAHPFTIHTDNFSAQVLGTELNVRGYQKDDSHVTLIEGSVKVQFAGKDVMLRPGEDAELTTDHQIKVSEVDTDIFASWKNGEFYYDNISLLDVARQVGRWYNIDVVFNNPKAMLMFVHFQGERNATIEQTVGVLNLLGKAQFSYRDGKLYID